MPNQGDFSKAVEELLTPTQKRCVVGQVFDELKGNDADSFTALLASPVSNIKIAELLQKNGFKIGETAVWKHRKDNCSCARTK